MIRPTSAITPEARNALKTALFHMLSMWDALNTLETELNIDDLESSEISGPASNLSVAGDAFDLDDAELDDIIRGFNNDDE